MSESSEGKQRTSALAAHIVAAYVAHNKVAADDLPSLLRTIYVALAAAGGPAPRPEAPLVPAVPIRRSVTEEFIICLEDGKKLKSMKRHLSTRFGMTPQQYRAKWGLPASYPMIAPASRAARSETAKRNGLGSKKPAVTAEAAPAPSKPARPRVRKKAAS